MSTKVGYFVLKPWKIATISKGLSRGLYTYCLLNPSIIAIAKGHLYCAILALNFKGGTYVYMLQQ